MSRFRVEVRTIRAGQPRAYADSVYESDIIFSNWWDSTTGEREGNWCPHRDTVKKLAALLVHDFVDSENRHMLDPYLESISKVGPQVWKVVIIDPYCD